MEFRIEIDDTEHFDLGRVTDAVQVFDPAALVDFDADSGRLRVGTVLPARVLVDVLSSSGMPLLAHDLHSTPSTCCGGCGG